METVANLSAIHLEALQQHISDLEGLYAQSQNLHYTVQNIDVLEKQILEISAVLKLVKAIVKDKNLINALGEVLRELKYAMDKILKSSRAHVGDKFWSMAEFDDAKNEIAENIPAILRKLNGIYFY